MRKVVAFAVGVFACADAAQAHLHEIFIGRSAAGQLKIKFGGHPPVVLAQSVHPQFPGWADAQPGFEATIIDYPAEDFYILSPTSNIEWMLVAIGPNLTVINQFGSGPMLVGETYLLGNPVFDVHPFYHIPTGIPGHTTFFRFKVRDRSGTFTDSIEVEIPFTPEGCYPNCDGSTTEPTLNVQDFGCYLNLFATGSTQANCDMSNSPPILNVQDFSCFLNSFASGCH